MGSQMEGRMDAHLDGLPIDALRAKLDETGVGGQHAETVFHALHRDLAPLHTLSKLGPRRLSRLLEVAKLSQVQIARAYSSADGTERWIYGLEDGLETEGVLIPMRPGPVPQKGQKSLQRNSLCVSSQVGCPVGCAFCATGRLGLRRSLQASEILGQIAAARRRAAELDRPITHLVFMGMGEPFLNQNALFDVLKILSDPHGWCLDAKHITVSTVGFCDRIDAFAEAFKGRFQLALSLHAGSQALREKLIPAAKQSPLDALHETLKRFPLPGSRYLMLEYLLLPGVNDSPEELEGLCHFAKDLRCIVNLIPFNAFEGCPFRSPNAEEISRAFEHLRNARIPCSIRQEHGQKIHGACGMLSLKQQSFQSVI